MCDILGAFLGYCYCCHQILISDKKQLKVWRRVYFHSCLRQDTAHHGRTGQQQEHEAMKRERLLVQFLARFVFLPETSGVATEPCLPHSGAALAHSSKLFHPCSINQSHKVYKLRFLTATMPGSEPNLCFSLLDITVKSPHKSNSRKRASFWLIT